MTKELKSITDLTPDDNNANKGTLRGLAMLEDSIEQYGPGRSILVDAEGRVIAGNKTLQAAIDKGIDVIVVPTDGDKLVVVQRRDLNLKRDKRARELATADNRVAQVDLDWNPEALLADMDNGINLASFWDEGELSELLAAAGNEDWAGALSGLPSGSKPPFQQMTFTLSNAQASVVAKAIKKAKADGEFTDTDNKNSNGNALYRICNDYLQR